jgi:hypothetical protein
MSFENYYASIAVVELTPENKILIESISVTKGECVLSGAWGLEISDVDAIGDVLSGKLLIILGNEENFRKQMKNLKNTSLSAQPFLDEARIAAGNALAAYENFKGANLAKRKKMVAPEFYEWPESIDFNKSAEFMQSIGKMPTPASTPLEFRNVLSTARLLKHLIDMWQLDEQDRTGRKYVEGEDSEITILPKSWLELLPLS